MPVWILFATILTTRAAEGADHLEPESGLFAGIDLYSYDLAVSRLLLGPLPCDLVMVALPSFRPERALCVMRKGDQFEVHARRLEPMLWGAMMTRLQEGAKKHGTFSLEDESMHAAIAGVKVSVETAVAPLDTVTFEAVRHAWTESLRRVRHPDTNRRGHDGEASHFIASSSDGTLAGKTWSPEPDTAVGQLVALGRLLEAFAQAPTPERARLSKELKTAAMALAAKLSSP